MRHFICQDSYILVAILLSFAAFFMWAMDQDASQDVEYTYVHTLTECMDCP